MVVTNPEHRKRAEEIWKLPSGLLPAKPGYHAVEQDRMLKDGKLNFYWVQVNNNIQASPNTSHEAYPGYRNRDNFIVVSDVYPTITTRRRVPPRSILATSFPARPPASTATKASRTNCRTWKGSIPAGRACRNCRTRSSRRSVTADSRPGGVDPQPSLITAF
jgi:hypothetical protein